MGGPGEVSESSRAEQVRVRPRRSVAEAFLNAGGGK
jgi:hypothetical protein